MLNKVYKVYKQDEVREKMVAWPSATNNVGLSINRSYHDFGFASEADSRFKDSRLKDQVSAVLKLIQCNSLVRPFCPPIAKRFLWNSVQICVICG